MRAADTSPSPIESACTFAKWFCIGMLIGAIGTLVFLAATSRKAVTAVASACLFVLLCVLSIAYSNFPSLSAQPLAQT